MDRTRRIERMGIEMDENRTEIPYGTQEERLKTINEAIYSILAGGQSYRIGTHSLTRADLATLISERDRIESQIKSGGAGFIDGAYAADFGFDNRR
jgi:hypothetical protein